MPYRAVTVREGEASLDQFSIDLVEEAEFDRVGGVGPDGKVATPFGKGRA